MSCRSHLKEINQGDDYSIVLENIVNGLPSPIVGDVCVTVIDGFGDKHREYRSLDDNVFIDKHVALVYLRDTMTWREGVYNLELRITNGDGSSSDSVTNVLRVVKRVSDGY